MQRGEMPVQGTPRSGPIGLRIGFASEDLGDAIDLGLPAGWSRLSGMDPEKSRLRRCGRASCSAARTCFAEQRGKMVNLRRSDSGERRSSPDQPPAV